MHLSLSLQRPQSGGINKVTDRIGAIRSTTGGISAPASARLGRLSTLKALWFTMFNNNDPLSQMSGRGCPPLTQRDLSADHLWRLGVERSEMVPHPVERLPRGRFRGGANGEGAE